MKVLWFTNTPVGADEVLKAGDTRGNWLKALERVIKNKVSLSVAFYYARFAKPFVHEEVSYYPICKKHWRINVIKDIFFGDLIDDEDLELYLEIIGRVKPDVIHIHGTENPFSCLINKTEIPIVISIQGNCTVYSHKYYSGIERKYGSNKGINLLSPITWLLNKSFNQQFRKLKYCSGREINNIKNCKNIIGRTDWDRRITRILAPESVYYHNDEIIRDLFYTTKWTAPGNAILIIHSTIGESYYKGFDTICQTLSALQQIGIKLEWRVAGISRHSLLDKVVRRKLKENYPTSGLVLLGNLVEHDLIAKMLESDLYVMPSHIENSPNSLCEAMLLGMPCITTHAGGTPSLLRDKEEGIVIQDGDPWSMAGAILELLYDKSKAGKYGNNARIKALYRHNKEKIVTELLTIYGNIAHGSNIHSKI